MLRRAITHYEQLYQFQDLFPADLNRLIDAVKLRGNYEVFAWDVVPTAHNGFKRNYGATKLPELFELLRHKREHLRRYTVVFATEKLGKRPLADLVHVAIRVQRLPKYPNADADQAVSLSGYGCSQPSFNEFVKIAQGLFDLKEKSPAGIPPEDYPVVQRFDSATRHQGLINLVSGPLKAGQADLAVKAAIGLVESELRDACIAAGSNVAGSQSGCDLAVTAFHKDKGVLTPPWPVATEAASGAQLMTQGFMMYLRNAFAHHTVVMGTDKSAVFECISFCEFLLLVISKSTPR